MYLSGHTFSFGPTFQDLEVFQFVFTVKELTERAYLNDALQALGFLPWKLATLYSESPQ